MKSHSLLSPKVVIYTTESRIEIVKKSRLNMNSEVKCDFCGNSLFPNNIGRIVKKGSEKEYIKICKACKKPKGRNMEKRGRGRPPLKA